MTRSAPAGIDSKAHCLDPAARIRSCTIMEEVFESEARPRTEWAVAPGLELQGFDISTYERLSPEQLQAVIRGLAPVIIDVVEEDGTILEAVLGSRTVEGDIVGRLRLKPGGQIEFSGTKRKTLSAVEGSVKWFIRKLDEAADGLGLIFVACGMDPLHGIADQKWIQSERFKVMSRSLRKRGQRALDTLARTASMQVCLDFESLQDMAVKLMVATRIAPVASAIFANSPFSEGRLSGYKSTRAAVLLDTDRDRTGPCLPALAGEQRIEKYIDYLASVPMIFIRRGGRFLDLSGMPFSHYLREGEDPLVQDLLDHLSAILTEARLNPGLEQRSADPCSVELLMACLAFWKGLLYDPETLELAAGLAPDLRESEFRELQFEVARFGLGARLSTFHIMDFAIEMVELSRAGLNRISPEEVAYLDILEERVISEQISPADILIGNFSGSWKGDATRALRYLRIR